VYDLDGFPSWEEVMVACPLQSESELRIFWQGFEQHQQELVHCIERQDFDDFEDMVSLFPSDWQTQYS
jgi:hypothetical protein